MGQADREALEAKIAEGTAKERKEKRKAAKQKLKAQKEGFFKDFKKFITKGNIVDMAVAVIVGAAFTAIINALSNGILKPIINWIIAKIIGADSLEEAYTFLTKVTKIDDTGAEVVDLANSIYIDWGTFINAIINFFLVAMTLFVIARIARRLVNKAKEKQLAEAAAAEEKKKAEEKAKAEAAASVAAEKEAQLQAFYANVARQTELLEQLSKK